MAEFDDIKAAVETEFPGWLVWCSDAGLWYATRSDRLTEDQIQTGYAMTVAADDPANLRRLLREQPGPPGSQRVQRGH